MEKKASLLDENDALDSSRKAMARLSLTEGGKSKDVKSEVSFPDLCRTGTILFVLSVPCCITKTHPMQLEPTLCYITKNEI